MGTHQGSNPGLHSFLAAPYCDLYLLLDGTLHLASERIPLLYFNFFLTGFYFSFHFRFHFGHDGCQLFEYYHEYPSL
jgi:hypothetical protein